MTYSMAVVFCRDVHNTYGAADDQSGMMAIAVELIWLTGWSSVALVGQAALAARAWASVGEP